MKVLIIDDESLVRRSLSRIWQQNHEVYEAEDGEKGYKRWLEIRPDLVFLDVLMPGMSGPEVLEKLGKDKCGYIVLISAYSGQYNIETAKKLGADLFIPKPFDNIFEIVDKVELLLGGREKH